MQNYMAPPTKNTSQRRLTKLTYKNEKTLILKQNDESTNKQNMIRYDKPHNININITLNKVQDHVFSSALLTPYVTSSA